MYVGYNKEFRIEMDAVVVGLVIVFYSGHQLPTNLPSKLLATPLELQISSLREIIWQSFNHPYSIL